MKTSTFTLDTADGMPVHVYRWLPESETRGVLQISHGLAEHAGRYAHVAEALTERGWAVYADDHRGHGRTAATEDDLAFLGEKRGWASVLDDMYRLIGVARDEHPGVPVVLMGHSGGSFLTQQFLFTFPGTIDGAVLSGTRGAPGAIGEVGAIAARVERVRLGPRGRSPLLDFLAFGSYNNRYKPARTKFDWLSRDPDAVDAYVADPLCGAMYTTQLFSDLVGGLRLIARPELQAKVPKDLPIYVFAGELDPVGEYGKSVRKLLQAYEQTGLRRVTHRLYPGGRHEMLNEINRQQVIDELAGWLDETLLEPAGS